MNTQDESRKAMAKARLHQEHIDENILLRSQEEIDRAAPNLCRDRHSNKDVESESRESMVKQRQQEEHTKKTMLTRSESEIN
jgi:hypothetical protein